MAKLHNKTVQAALNAIIASGRATPADKPLADQGLIEVNMADIDAHGNVAARLTQKGTDGMPAPKAGAATGAVSAITLISGIVLPESKRGFGRKEGESKYPFKTMDVGVSFFVPNSEADGDALKKMGSTVSNANNKFRTATTETRSVTRKVKGGNGEKETVNLPVYKAERKFTVRGVKKGQVLGSWTALEDGAIVQRTV